MENYLTISLQVTAMQVLESVYIIYNSSNIETVISRQKFLEEKYGDLLLNQHNPDYLTNIQIATKSYQERNYDRPFQEIQLVILRNTEEFNLANFYSDSLLNALKRFCVKQSEEINIMKTVAAKHKRSAKVLQTIELVKKEMTDKFSTSSGFHQALNAIVELEIRFNI